MQKITPCLWFDHQAEEAVHFYLSIFPEGQIVKIARYSEAGPGPAGSVMSIEFELLHQRFTAINGGPVFQFNEAISLTVNCETQEEVDTYWSQLSAGGEEVQCGWLKDKYGLSWQIVPTVLGDFFSTADGARSQRVMQAMLQMKKLDIAALTEAYEAA